MPLTDYKEIRFYGAIGRHLKNARRKANLTQLDLARMIGVERTTITNMEKGIQGMSLYQAALIAEILPEWRTKL